MCLDEYPERTAFSSGMKKRESPAVVSGFFPVFHFGLAVLAVPQIIGRCVWENGRSAF
jgi:hypothetical protein